MGKRCLFVASGETALAASDHLAWGDLVTLNRSLEFFDRAKVAFIGTKRKLEEMLDQLGKADLFVPLFDTKVYEISALPPKRTWVPPIVQTKEPKGGREALRSHIQSGHVVGRGAAALVCLRSLGYSTIWLFGHDGGRSRLPGLGDASARGYDKGRFCTEVMAEYLELNVAFYPERPSRG